MEQLLNAAFVADDYAAISLNHLVRTVRLMRFFFCALAW